MGHYASEMDPGWGDRIDATDRRIKLRDAVAKVKLKNVTVGELIGVLGLFTDDVHIYGCSDEEGVAKKILARERSKEKP